MDEAWSAGLVMAGIFVWILGFPFFGPLVGAVRGYQGFGWAYVFGFAHGAGLLLLSLPVGRHLVGHRVVLPCAAILFILTGSVVLLSLPFWLLFLLLIVMGLAAADLVVAWSPWFAAQSRPHLALAVLIVGANLPLLLLPPGIGGAPLVAVTLLLSLLPFVAAVFLSRRLKHHAFPPGFPSAGAASSPVAALAAFAVAGYVIGGLMYQRIFPAAVAGWPGAAVWGTAAYCLAAVAAAAAVQRWRLPLLSTLTLTTLALGLIVFTDRSAIPHGPPLSLLIVMAGLGGVDMFFWLSLWTLSRQYGARRTFGTGLGANVLLVTATGELAGSGLLHHLLAFPALNLMAIVLVLLAVPFVAHNTLPTRQPATRPDLPPSPEKSGEPDEGPPKPARPPYFNQLSKTEREVFDLLIQGASDLDIAQTLFISRNTAKFHVLNILKKAGFKYRKELLSSIIKDLQAPDA